MLFSILRMSTPYHADFQAFSPAANRTHGAAVAVFRDKVCVPWHGNTFRALQTVSWLLMDINVDQLTEKQKKLRKNLEEFKIYIRYNAGLIPNYAERWRYGESISTEFVESTINYVVSKQMVKKVTDALESTERPLVSLGPHSRFQ
jgi:hypothetical protein